MKYLIRHFYGKEPPVPEAVALDNGFEVEIDDITAFVEKHGNIVLSPPDQYPCRGHWFIWVTDETGMFKAK